MVPFVVALYLFQFMVCCVAKLDTPSLSRILARQAEVIFVAGSA
jgi:hypothetical protein